MFFDGPPAGKIAMAYKSVTHRASAVPGHSRAWEELRKEARKLEGELDVKMAAFNKLCSGFEAAYKIKADNSGLGADQLAQTKSSEIEDLLQRLSDVNDEMGGTIGGSTDARSHTLARHRDILQEFSQEYRRLSSTLGAARDRVQLLSGGSETAHVTLQMPGSSTGALLRERATVQSSTNAVDEVISQATSVSSSLIEQRRVFDNVGDKILSIGARFPVVNGLLNAIRRKKSKDTLVLSAVIAGCVIFTLMYMAYK
eukprot:gene20094-26812_t